MRVITFKENIEDSALSSVSISTETKNVVVSFSAADCKTNAAHAHMTAKEARWLAMDLIVYANKLDPYNTL